MSKEAWEQVSESVARHEVPGGWIYRVVTLTGHSYHQSVAFVPFPPVKMSDLCQDITVKLDSTLRCNRCNLIMLNGQFDSHVCSTG